MRISLLHATYRAGPSAVQLRDEWLASATDPGGLEHIFASNADDEISQGCPQIAAGVVGPPVDGVTAVRNWNAAAEAATGDLLVVIADDLHPCADWDAALIAAVRDLDPQRASFVLKFADNPEQPHRLAHPAVSRRYYQRFGLWHPGYEGHFVDNDFTLSAHGHGLVIDARHLRFPHIYGTKTAGRTESQQLMADRTFEAGRAVFDSRFPKWKRRRRIRYFTPRNGQHTVSEMTRLIRCAACRLGYLAPLSPRRVARRFRGMVRRA